MKQSNKRCWSCGSFRAYYTRGYCCLLKEKNGYCNRHEKVTEKSDSCDNWYCRRTSKEKRIRIAVNAIPEIYHKIAIIEQLLMEETELQRLRDEAD